MRFACCPAPLRSVRLRAAVAPGALAALMLAGAACTSTSSAPLGPSGSTTPSVVTTAPGTTAPVSVSSSSTPANNSSEQGSGSQPPTSPVQGRAKTPDPAPAPAP